MCGIAGFYSKSTLVSEDILRKMTNAISHRGPDAEGIYINKQQDAFIGLGHRRLSILDLSESANQPFFSSCGNYVIIFNGEIYNYRELYQHIDNPLRTSGDTEVILELFIKKGPDFVSLLNGMFAFVIYDIKNETLWIYRDRLGVKPIFYGIINNDFYFASEIKALTICPFIKSKLTLNTQAINYFLHLGYIPQPHTIYNEIIKFPSGNYGKIKNGKLELKSYWSAEEKITKNIISNYQEAKEALKTHLVNSIKYRMISDVPVGTFLSGGIDSSIVTAIAQQQSPFPIKSFSIGFKENKFNESVHAAKIANYLGTNHHEYILSQKDAQEELLAIIDNFDEPYADSSALPVHMVSKIARQHVKVVLTGDGGDECFMGYNAYTWAKRISNPILQAFRLPLSATFKTFGNSKIKRIGELLDYGNASNLKSHIFSQEQYCFSEMELKKLIAPEYYSTFDLKFDQVHLNRKLAPEESQALFDINYYLRDDLLVKVDRASMLNSIESREPLLDYKLVEFSLALSQKLKIKDGIQKYLLKEVLYDYIPKQFFERPKWGFSIPLSEWLKKDMHYLIDEYLSENQIKKTGILEHSTVNQLIKRFSHGEYYLYNRLWLMIVLQRWLLKNN